MMAESPGGDRIIVQCFMNLVIIIVTIIVVISAIIFAIIIVIIFVPDHILILALPPVFIFAPILKVILIIFRSSSP